MKTKVRSFFGNAAGQRSIDRMGFEDAGEDLGEEIERHLVGVGRHDFAYGDPIVSGELGAVNVSGQDSGGAG